MEPLYFEEKSASQPWFSERKYMSRTYFLSENEGIDDNFNPKQKAPMRSTHRGAARVATLPTPLELSLRAFRIACSASHRIELTSNQILSETEGAAVIA